MYSMVKRATVIGVALCGLLLFAVACSGTPPAVPQQPQTPTVVLITQIVTQIVAPTPLAVTPTTPATHTPEPTAPKPTYDPLSAPIYYPLEDCVASRLHVGDVAQVSLYGGANGIRYGSDLSADTVFAYAQPGALLEIINGPWCSQGWLIWQVRMADGQVGYTPEGNGNEYWLFPSAP